MFPSSTTLANPGGKHSQPVLPADCRQMINLLQRTFADSAIYIQFNWPNSMLAIKSEGEEEFLLYLYYPPELQHHKSSSFPSKERTE
jgi:hypothetical protein